MRRYLILIILGAVLALAGCGSRNTTSPSQHTAYWVEGYNWAVHATDSGGAIFEANQMASPHLTPSQCKPLAVDGVDAAHADGAISPPQSNFSQFMAGYYAGCLAYLKANHWLN